MPGVIRLLAEELTGGDVGKFFKEMESGSYKSTEVLPKLFTRMGLEAAKGWGKYTNSTRYQQGQANVGFENQVMLFGQQGGNDSFFRMWKAFAETLPQTNNLVKALAAGFNGLARGVEGTGSIIAMLDDGLERFNKLNPDIQSGLTALGSAFFLLGTKIGRAFLPLTAAYLVLEDIAAYRQGKKSITGLAMGEDYSGKKIDPKFGTRLDASERLLGRSASEQMFYWASGEGTAKERLASFMTMPFMAPIALLEQTSKGIGWAASGMGHDPVKLTPSNSIDSMINNIAYGGGDSTMSARGIGKSFYVDTINMYPTSNSPEEFDYLLNRNAPFITVGE